MELHVDIGSNGSTAHGRCRDGRRHEVQRQRGRRARAKTAHDSPRQASDAVRARRGRGTFAAIGWHASLRARLADACGESASTCAALGHDSRGRLRLVSTPALARSSMAPRDWLGRTARRDGPGCASPEGPHRQGKWRHAAACRRLTLASLIVGQTWLATNLMVHVLPYQGRPALELVVLLLFTILFAWISAGFWTAIAGFATLALRRDRYAISSTTRPGACATDIPPDARTAIVMPICNEDVPRVFAGLHATFESLRATNALDRFDFFVLSDTTDADTRVDEVAAWTRLCRDAGGFGRVFYRWRQHRIKRKSGNIADFCRRWGRKYRYMVVLDADSVMTGECLARLVLMAEANPGAGIIQTVPRAAGRDTLFARVQQFATAVYGPVFAAGLHYWQLGESHYWGHNAIIRIAPFMRHCALGRLPGRGALSGEILSHDFVEAALMRRAGWSVWIAYDLPGSYEEMPPNLLDELSRDLRWCQGNLMNARLLLMKGLHPAHRVVFMTGAMAYLSAPLWFMFLIAATGLVAVHTFSIPQYFVHPFQLFPLWPRWHPERAVTLFALTASLLFAPKILASLLVEAKGCGGRLRLALSVLLECALSALLAPVRMLFHTQAVVASLLGRAVRWRSPARADAETRWAYAVRRHGLHTLLGVSWTGLMAWMDPQYMPWLLPVTGALMLSIPLSVLSSRVSWGRVSRRWGLFLIAEETRPPAVLEATQRGAKVSVAARGVLAAVVDPAVNALMCAYGVARRLDGSARAQRGRLVEQALSQGLGTLSSCQRAALVADPVALSTLHHAVRHDGRAHPSFLPAPASAGRRRASICDDWRPPFPGLGRPPAVPVRRTDP
jgi:membrane glycosyltransferase